MRLVIGSNTFTVSSFSKQTMNISFIRNVNRNFSYYFSYLCVLKNFFTRNLHVPNQLFQLVLRSFFIVRVSMTFFLPQLLMILLYVAIVVCLQKTQRGFSAHQRTNRTLNRTVSKVSISDYEKI